MRDNYRQLLIAIVVVGFWLCGMVFGFGSGAMMLDEPEATVSGYILFCVVGIVSTVTFTMVVLAGMIYPELSKTVEKE